MMMMMITIMSASGAVKTVQILLACFTHCQNFRTINDVTRQCTPARLAGLAHGSSHCTPGFLESTVGASPKQMAEWAKLSPKPFSDPRTDNPKP